MRKILFTFICLSMALTAVAQNQIDKQGRKQGHWIRTDKNGAKIYEGTFKDDKEIDTFSYYYSDGKLRLRNIYSVPGRYCSHEAYDEKGNLLAKGFYNQKNRDGEWRLFTEAGKLIKITHYRMGIREGLQVIFTSNGDTAEVSTWVDNHRDGRWWKRINEKGWITGTFTKGALNGVLVEYDNDGKLFRQGNYKNGEKDGDYKYYESGANTIVERWQDGTLMDRQVLISAPDPTWVSTAAVAYFYPKGTGCILYKMDGTVLTCTDNYETLHSRLGSEQFVSVDTKHRIVANQSCIQGLTRDEEGREILSLDPKPAFSVFPDENCIKMVKALKRIDELDE